MVGRGNELAPKPVSVRKREAVDDGTGMVTTGTPGQPLEELLGRRELWAWLWEMKPGWKI